MFDRYRKLFESADWDALGQLYAPDAFLDANVPLWRFQLQGRDKIAEQYREWYGDTPSTITEWTVAEAPSSATIMMAEETPTPDGPLYSRTAHVFTIADGLIAEHVMYCTGPWDAQTVARHRDEAPMIRW